MASVLEGESWVGPGRFHFSACGGDKACVPSDLLTSWVTFRLRGLDSGVLGSVCLDKFGMQCYPVKTHIKEVRGLA